MSHCILYALSQKWNPCAVSSSATQTPVRFYSLPAFKMDGRLRTGSIVRCISVCRPFLFRRYAVWPPHIFSMVLMVQVLPHVYWTRFHGGGWSRFTLVAGQLKHRFASGFTSSMYPGPVCRYVSRIMVSIPASYIWVCVEVTVLFLLCQGY